MKSAAQGTSPFKINLLKYLDTIPKRGIKNEKNKNI
jgi:hypothetical protein